MLSYKVTVSKRLTERKPQLPWGSTQSFNLIILFQQVIISKGKMFPDLLFIKIELKQSQQNLYILSVFLASVLLWKKLNENFWYFKITENRQIQNTKCKKKKFNIGQSKLQILWANFFFFTFLNAYVVSSFYQFPYKMNTSNILPFISIWVPVMHNY